MKHPALHTLRGLSCVALLVGLHGVQAPALAGSSAPVASPGTATGSTSTPAMAGLPLSDALVQRHGTGRRQLAVFADPYCPYCRKLEADLYRMQDVTIYNFLLPVLQPDSTAKSRGIWCASDNAKAWRDWMLSGKSAPDGAPGCDRGALARNLVLAQRLGIRGTPALVFADGQKRVGNPSPEALAQLLDTTQR